MADVYRSSKIGKVFGRVARGSKDSGVVGLRVEAWDRDEAIGAYASGFTTADGAFVLEPSDALGELLERWHPQAMLRIFEKNILIHQSGSVIDDAATGGEVAHVVLPQTEAASERVVEGDVRDADGAPQVGMVVKAVDVGLRAERPLGKSGSSARTDHAGHYRIPYRITTRAHAAPVRKASVAKSRRQDQAPGHTTHSESAHPTAGTPLPPRPASTQTQEVVNLVVRVYDAKAQKMPIAQSPVLFDAPASAVVNVDVGGVFHGLSECTRADEKIDPFLGGVQPAQLQATDVGFIAESTRLDPSIVASYVTAAQLAAATGISPQQGYALASSGASGDADALARQSPDAVKSALARAVSANVVPPSVAGTGDEIVGRLRSYAVANALDVRALVGTVLPSQPDRDRFLILAAQYDAGDPSSSGRPPTPVVAAPEAAPPATVSQSGNLASSAGSFWDAVDADAVLGPKADDLRFCVQASVLTQNNLALVQRLQALRTDNTISGIGDLAGYDEKGWMDLLGRATGRSAIQPPNAVPGGSAGTRRQNFALVLSRLVEDAFPDKAICLRAPLDRRQDILQKDLATFFAADPNYAPTITNPSRYLEDHPRVLDNLKLQNKDALLERLKDFHRMARFTSRYSEMAALQADGLRSAYQISRFSRDAFVGKYEDAFGALRARQIHRAATLTAAMAMHLTLELAPPFNTGTRAVPFEHGSPVEVPDWEQLFGDVALCQCEECNTVLSPAAYLTDILSWLDERPNLTGNKAKDVLDERRPDLSQIELTCSNTNTAMPYVDLALEVLENAIAPLSLPAASAASLDLKGLPAPVSQTLTDHGLAPSDAAVVEVVTLGQEWLILDLGWRLSITKPAAVGADLTVVIAPQTSRSQDDLAASPEHTNDAAYQILNGAVFPFSLPFDFPVEEARAYLHQLGVERYTLMRAFQTTTAPSPAPTDAQIAAERIGLNPTAASIVTFSHPSAAASPYVFWGVGAAGWPGALQSVDTLLQQASLTYAELTELLKLGYTNPGLYPDVYAPGEAELVVVAGVGPDPAHPWDPNTCDTKELVFARRGSPATADSLDADRANRIGRFVRLWRSLGWPARDLDRAIRALKPAEITDEFLRMLGDIVSIASDLRVVPTTVLSWFSRLETFAYADTELPAPKSLYEELFEDPSIVRIAGASDDPFALNSAGSDLSDATQSLQISGPTDAQAVTKQRLRAAIGSALAISQDDLATLLESPRKVTPDATLNLENLSRLYRSASLARALKLTVQDLLTLIELFGVSPFVNDGAAVTAGDTKGTREFIETVARVRASGFSIPMLAYILRHEQPLAPAPASLGPPDLAIATLLGGLRTGLKKTFDATTARPDPQGVAVGQALATLGWDAGRSKEALDALSGTTVVYSTALAALGVNLPSDLPITYDGPTHTLSFTGAMTNAQLAKLQVGNATYNAAVLDLWSQPRAWVTSALKSFVDEVHSVPLAELPSDVSFPEALSSKVSFDSDAATLSFIGLMDPTDRDLLTALPTGTTPADLAYVTAVGNLFNATVNDAVPVPDQFLGAVDASTLFDGNPPPSTDCQNATDRYLYVLRKLDAYLRVSESLALVKQTFSATFGVESAVADWMITKWHYDPTNPQGLVQDLVLATDFVVSGDKPTEARFPDLFRAYRALWKIAQIITALGLSSDEVVWLDEWASKAGWLVFNTLPTFDTDPRQGDWTRWARLVEATTLRSALSDNSATFFGLISQALSYDPAAPAANKLALIGAWSDFTAWPIEDLATLLGAPTDPTATGLLEIRLPVLAADPNDYADVHTWTRMQQLFSILKRIGTSPAQAQAWAQPDLCDPTIAYDGEAAARNARNTVAVARANYENDQWRSIAEPLRDVLRDRQRARLVDFLVANPLAGTAWKKPEDLTDYFLIDCEMTSCMLTSRIKQAISSVQVFAQRCLLNLESEVDASGSDWAPWEAWMDRIQLWTANREVFLWPENWADEAVRDDKTPFFKTFENALSQQDANADAVEEAFIGYLEDLDEVANLQVGGMIHEWEAASDGALPVDVMHVLARTASVPPKWFYRQRINDGELSTWTPWEKVDAQIEAEGVMPVIWNRRLFVFWPEVTSQAEQVPLNMPLPNNPVAEPPTDWFVKLSWTERREGKWTAKKTTTVSVDTRGSYFLASRIMLGWQLTDAGLKVDVEVMHPHPLEHDVQAWWVGSVTFAGAQPAAASAVFSPTLEPTADVDNTILSGTDADAMTWQEQQQDPAAPDVELSLLDGTSAAPTDVVVLEKTPGNAAFRVAAENAMHMVPEDPVFFSDGDHSYYVTNESENIWISLRDANALKVGWAGVPPWDHYAAVRSDPLLPIGTAEPTQIFEQTYPVERTKPASTFALAPGKEMDSHTLVQNVRSLESPGWQPGGLTFTTLDKIAGNNYMFTDSENHEINSLAGYYISQRTFHFEIFYHPYVREFMRQLIRNGVDGLFEQKLQLSPWTYTDPAATAGFDFNGYAPTDLVDKNYPVEDVDFSYSQAYAQYNWELFFHAPLLMATKLSQNQQFADADRCFRRIFDPTGVSTDPGAGASRYWRTRPFHDATADGSVTQQIEDLINSLASGQPAPELSGQFEKWVSDPFNPHLIARLRKSVYPRYVVMKYLDNLIAWGDQHYAAGTLEDLPIATLLYMLGLEILGPEPPTIPARTEPVVQTFATLAPRFDEFSDKLVAAESLVPVAPSGSGGATTPVPTLGHLLYFAVPRNDKLYAYWTTLKGRLASLRACRNIEGQEFHPPLFEPSIDPGLLIAAHAAGVDLASVLADVSAPLPPYRFEVVAAKATEICQQVMALGGAMLAALEKRDAEDLALLRSSQEVDVLTTMRAIKQQAVSEADAAAEAAQARQDTITARGLYYQALLTNKGTPAYSAEASNLELLGQSKDAQETAGNLQTTAGIAHFVPDFKIGAPPTDGSTYGGSNVGAALGVLAGAAATAAAANSMEAAMAGLQASWLRRAEEWQHQVDQANLDGIEAAQQVVAATFRAAIAQAELDLHDQQIDNAQKVDDFLHSKYTNRDLYDYLVGEISSVYFQAYQLAYTVAKRAENCLRYELGLQSSNYIRFGYWDSLKKGLQAGEKLFFDLKRMEADRLDQDVVEREVTSVVALSEIAPEALIALRENGECFVAIPEATFNREHPHHYFRRIKAVGVTIPCVTGPFRGVHCTVSYQGGTLRIDPSTDPGYERVTNSPDTRFVDYTGPIQSIDTSHGQSDPGLFELNMRAPQYLPFEGVPLADSHWQLIMNKEANRFPLETVSDVFLEIKYTARDGGEALRAAAIMSLPPEEWQSFSARRDFSDAWHRFLYPAPGATDQLLELDLSAERFAYRPDGAVPLIKSVGLYLKVSGASGPNAPGAILIELHPTSDGTGKDLLQTAAGQTVGLAQRGDLDGLYARSYTAAQGQEQATGIWTATIAHSSLQVLQAPIVVSDAAGNKYFDPDVIEDLIVVCETISP